MRICKTCSIEQKEDKFFTIGYKSYRQHCKTCVLKSRKNYREKNKQQILLKRREHYKNNSKKLNKENRGYTKKLKLLIIKEYGGKCVCNHGKKVCGVHIPEYLTIDHIKGNGNKQRRKLKRFGTAMYYWLKKNNFPKNDYQLLCWNCNCSKGNYGGCPHNNKTKREEQCKQINGQVQ